MIINNELAMSLGHDQKDKWETPPKIFDPLMMEFGFTLDPCCEYHTRKCRKYFTPSENGLLQDWSKDDVFMNPPYSRGNIDLWVEKAYNESLKGALVVGLLPVSTSANWFHKWVWHKAEIRYYKGRIKFIGAPFTAPFSSMLAIWRP